MPLACARSRAVATRRTIRRASSVVHECSDFINWNEFHHEVQGTLLFKELIKSDDVVMPQIAHSLCFADETLTRFGDLTGRELRQSKFLDGKASTDSRVQRSVDDSPSSASELLEDLILTNPSHAVQ
ncbi:MAG: hypothetical protein JWN34_588 [Bryobacterales bacterium]|nr:hypothetical protein [Bryobacterales bacterium]